MQSWAHNAHILLVWVYININDMVTWYLQGPLPLVKRITIMTIGITFGVRAHQTIPWGGTPDLPGEGTPDSPLGKAHQTLPWGSTPDYTLGKAPQNLRAAQRAFLHTCQELVEVSLYTSETRRREQLLSMYPAMFGRQAKKLFEPPSGKF